MGVVSNTEWMLSLFVGISQDFVGYTDTLKAGVRYLHHRILNAHNRKGLTAFVVFLLNGIIIKVIGKEKDRDHGDCYGV